MELQFYVPLDPIRTQAVNLVINHRHCVASYSAKEITHDNVAFLDINTLNRKRRLYWNWLWSHPSHVPCPARAISDASEALTWFYTDNLISGSASRAPFSKTECEELAAVVKEMTRSSNEHSTAKTVFLAWLLREISSFRDAENWGLYTQKEAREIRQNSNNKRFSLPRPAPFLMPLVEFATTYLFFGIPRTYLAHVKSSFEFRGRLGSMQEKWIRYTERLVREYSDFLLIVGNLFVFALSATIGLLAVPGISEVAQVAATVSVFASLGSVIVGVFSIWRHQANISTSDSFTYMRNVQHSYLGYHGHALLLSLPPVLLVWAIITFTVSVICYTVQGIATLDPIQTLVCAAVVAALYTLSIIWSFRHHGGRPWARIGSASSLRPESM
ncbi:hypothetical protein C8J56DRAFT_934769 [Mycena floridula]|nr:hypothetical protein C8J56DRAFT_934769 [Mycena floridula]